MLRPIVSGSDSRIAYCVAKLIASAGALSAEREPRVFWHFCRSIGSLVEGRGYAYVVALSADSSLKIFLDDPYWSRMLADNYRYEPDFLRLLLELKDLDYIFIDCGANFGYWSVMVSGADLGRKPVVAVEPASDTFRILTENCSLNGDRFRCINRALSSSSGRPVAIDSSSGHAGASIGFAPTTGRELITTITLDELIADTFSNTSSTVLVKLDVEGQEIETLKGAAHLMENDVLFYYEDHGSDPGSRVTGYILAHTPLEVFFLPEHGPVLDIRSANGASLQKKRASVGYNFLACRPSSVFLQRIKLLQ